MDPQQLQSYDVRILMLVPINIKIRSQFALIFSDYTVSPDTLFQVAMLLVFLFCFFFTSIRLFLPTRPFRYGALLFGFHFGYSEMASPLLTTALILSLLSPAPLFLCAQPFIILSSIWPSFFHLLRRLLSRCCVAFSAFLAGRQDDLADDPDTLV
uniref:Uncharacterized protein n=1 Tax=Opuntia streptacantha TaxID=393608 RepID=A0A7C9EHQ5_OPUST